MKQWYTDLTSGTELGSFSYISSMASAYRLEAPERKDSDDLAWLEKTAALPRRRGVAKIEPPLARAPADIVLRDAWEICVERRRDAARRRVWDVMTSLWVDANCNDAFLLFPLSGF